MKKLILLFVLMSSIAKAQCNASSFSPITVCAPGTTMSIAQSMQTDIIYICGQTAVVYDTLNPPSIKYRQVFINSGGRYYFKSTMTNNNVTVFAKNGAFCVILTGSSTSPMFTVNQEPAANVANLGTGTITVNNCSAIINPTTTINCSSTGVNETTGLLPLSVWPNPARGKVSVSMPLSFNGNIKLVNQLGQVLYTETVADKNNFELQLSPFPAGIYYLNFVSENGTRTEKLIISE